MDTNKTIKVGHISVYKLSYGSPLQSLATQKVFKRFGLECELIKYEPTVTFKEKAIKAIKRPSLIIKKAPQILKKITIKLNKEVSTKRNLRAAAFEHFCDEYISFTPLITTREERQNVIESYSVILSGSDQLWNPVNFDEGFFCCRIVPDNIKKISYASSFGTQVIPKEQLEGTKEYLNRFSKLSARESTGAQLMSNLTGKNVPVVLDPTLLLTSEEWAQYEPQQTAVEGDYIFAYFLSNKKEFRDSAKKLREKTGYKLVALPHMLQYNRTDVNFADEELYDVSPGKWMNIIRNAKYVCTDSYHGTVFSVLNHKQFLTMCAYEDNDVKSTNTRIYEVLQKAGLMNRVFHLNDNIEKIDDKIDYASVDDALQKHREMSFDYIRNILSAE